MPPRCKHHPLNFYRHILRLASEAVTADNYIDLAFCWMAPSRMRGIEIRVLGQVSQEFLEPGNKSALPRFPVPYEVMHALKRGARCDLDHSQHDVWCTLRACFTIAGGPIDVGSVAAIHTHLQRFLKMYAEGLDNALIPESEEGADFVIRGRRPFRGVEPVRADDGVLDPLTTDLQDIWYEYFYRFKAALRAWRGAWRPIGRCPVWWKPKRRLRSRPDPSSRRSCERFFFRSKVNQVTCGRPGCVERQKYLNTKARRQNSLQKGQ